MPSTAERQAAAAHTAQILAHLKRGERITHTAALDAFGCARLSARIFDLRKAGNIIASRMVQVGITKSGRPVRVAEYSLHP